jgi:excisionase family DNA binding protein
MQNVHFTPPQLAPLFGVNVSTIKRWVNKGYLPSTVTAGGHRRISQEQLEQFRKKFPQYAKNSYALKRLRGKNVCPPGNCWKKYYQQLLENKNDEAGQIIEKLYISGTPLLEILKNAVTPTMRHLAKQWSMGKITVFEEHRISFNMRSHLIKLERLIPDKTHAHSPVALLACAPGEYHELPMHLIYLIYKMHGWKTQVLGINISLPDLLAAAKKIKPNLITISKTYATADLTDYIQKLTKFTEANNICIALGGGAWKKTLDKIKNPDINKCAKFFPAIKLFSEYLNTYQRRT